MTHPYFTDKAREVFHKAGGDPDNAGPLAEWAERVRPDQDSWLRVIVAETGEIVGTARYNPGGGRVGASYITSAVDPRCADLVGREMGLALGGFRRIHGPVISVTFSEVCTGAGEQR